MSNPSLDTLEKSGNLNFTLATFTYLLHDEDHVCSDSSVQSACTSLKDAANKAFAARVAENVSEVLKKAMGSAPETAKIEQFLQENYPEESYSSVSPQELGAQLVDALNTSLGMSTSAEDIQQWLQNNYPNTNFSYCFEGNDRDEKISSIRKYSFLTNRPWLAQIAARSGSEITTQWVLVEDFTDSVTCMDPYPWDDIDEEYTMSLEEFMVRWELAGERSIALLS